MSGTLLASASRMLWRTIDSYGVDADRLFADAGLDPAKINDPVFRYPLENARRAWSLAAARVPDPCFGAQVGAHWRPTDLHALGFAFLSSPTLHNALQRIVRFNAIVDDVITFEATAQDQVLLLTYRNDREDLPDIAALEVARWSIVVAMCRLAAGGNFTPLRVELTNAGDACLDNYRGYFGCEVLAPRPQSRLVCDLAALDLPLPAPNTDLARINERAITDYLDRLHGDALAKQVAQLIRELLATGHLSAERVAQAACMTPRTLQRRLAQEGTSYKAVLEEVRSRLAQDYLRDPRLSMAEISYLLGFSEPSAFARAFRRWTGVSPLQLRRQTRAD